MLASCALKAIRTIEEAKYKYLNALPTESENCWGHKFFQFASKWSFPKRNLRVYVEGLFSVCLIVGSVMGYCMVCGWQ